MTASYEDFLQTDAPINHGNSGGALVNMKGELVGINSQILSNSDGNIGIGFAIPANMARHVMTDLRTDGQGDAAQLGVAVQTITPDMAESLGLKEARGVIVSSVAPDSAAEKAGLKRGDVISSLNGQPVRDMNTLRNRVADAGPGSVADLKVLRDGAEKEVKVTLETADARRAARDGDDRDSENGGSATNDRAALGINVAPLTPELAGQLGVKRDTKGVVVRDVDPDGRAADVLRPGRRDPGSQPPLGRFGGRAARRAPADGRQDGAAPDQPRGERHLRYGQSQRLIYSIVILES